MFLDNGIDKDATTGLYNKCDARRQGILQKIMLGGVWTNHRRHLADSTVSERCSCEETETLGHLWWAYDRS